MLKTKLINTEDNIVFLTHALPKIHWTEMPIFKRTPELAGLGQIISLVNDDRNFSCPDNLLSCNPLIIKSQWGELDLRKNNKDLLDRLSGKNLYFSGGNFYCCLANTVKSLYPLPVIENRDMTFTFIEDYIYVLWNDGAEAVSLKQFRVGSNRGRMKSAESSYIFYKNPLNGNINYWQNFAKKNKVNIHFSYHGWLSEFYDSPRSKYTIDLEVKSWSEIGEN
ncbi:MAG: hypothetical protein LBD99_06315 [Candidatus Margulisbacteria bacterium]|jgi:hypothetical protein|nr:hypothetical protein [Candidatus Margulisiibacteriota bacterium]